MNSLLMWLNNHHYKLEVGGTLKEKSKELHYNSAASNVVIKTEIKTILDENDNKSKLVKVITMNDIDSRIGRDAVVTIKRVNSISLSGLMKYDCIEVYGNSFYRVMKEYKVNLSQISPVDKYDENLRFNMLSDIVCSLKCLNYMGTIHSDLKPSNIFINEENEAILSDYCNSLLFKGKDKLLERDERDLCFVCIDELLGKELDVFSDIWNFGLIFYYISSGKYPFLGINNGETLRNIKNVEYFALDNRRHNNFVKRLLCEEKDNRLKLDDIVNELDKLRQPERIENHVEETYEEDNEVADFFKCITFQFLGCGDYYYDHHRYEEAIPYLRKVVKYWLCDRDKRGWYERLGYSYFATNRFSNAIGSYNHALNLSYSKQDKERNTSKIGDCYMKLRNYKEAIVHYKNALQNSLSRNEKENNLGNVGECYFFSKNYNEAIRYYESALGYAIFEGNRRYYNNCIGNCYYSMDQYKRAIEYYMKELKLSSTKDERNRSNVNIGKCYFYLCDYNQAISYYVGILNNSPSNEYIELVNRNLADCYIRIEEYRKGLDALSKSLERSTNNSQRSKSYSSIGECYLGLNNNVEAFNNLKRARDLLDDNDSKYVYYRVMGKYYAKRNAVKQSRKCFETALRYNEKYEKQSDIDEIFNLINELNH